MMTYVFGFIEYVFPRADPQRLRASPEPSMTLPTRITADAPEARSADLVAGNIAKLRELFPDACTEGKIDFAVLKQLLGGAVDERDEKYGLNWHGKRQARQLALTPSLGTLRPCPEESVDWDTTKNLMIEGDNLEVLKLLQKSYAGKVKLIYIDPPYNTGNDFVYPDDYQDGIRNYQLLTSQRTNDGTKLLANPESSGRYHTDWLNMMYPRLKSARNLLSSNGIIAVSIDQNEVSNLRKLLEEIFGSENYVNTFCWISNLKGRQISGCGAAMTHEYIIIFAKEISEVSEFTTQVEWAKKFMPSAYKGFSYDVLRDSKSEYVLKNQLYNTNSNFNEETRRNLVYDIYYNPSSGVVKTADLNSISPGDEFLKISPHKNSDGKHKYHAWRWSRDKVEREHEDLEFIPESVTIFQINTRKS
jgi:adenine-specific DNA-methyltransferase